jgi:hypothetical protein
MSTDHQQWEVVLFELPGNPSLEFEEVMAVKQDLVAAEAFAQQHRITEGRHWLTYMMGRRPTDDQVKDFVNVTTLFHIVVRPRQ